MKRLPATVRLCLLVIASACLTASAAEQEFTWQNPLPVTADGLNGLRDPFIIKEGDTWYMTGTGKPFSPSTTPRTATPRASRCMRRPI